MDARKRVRGDFGLNVNGAFKKSKPEIDSLSSGIGSKLKPCTKFFSMAGCPFGENCHFLHYYPGGYNAVAQLMNLPPAPVAAPPTRPPAGPLPVQNGATQAAVKTKLCNKYGTAEGCKFNDKCHFAHGEWELGKPIIQSQEEPARAMGAIPGRFTARPEPSFTGRPEPVGPGPAASFGKSATAKISVDASLAGAIIGKGGVNSKQISWQTGAKLGIREHETDPNLRNIELEGSFEQIKQASGMVSELIVSLGSSGSGFGLGLGLGSGVGGKGPHLPPGPTKGHQGHGSNFKTKLCENFAKGSCTFGEKCHFAHGVGELRNK